MDVKPHQEAGVKWCLDIEDTGHQIGDSVIHGGIIADEMGLGKTIQMLGVCVCNIRRRTLIVLPRALLEQWRSVFATTANHNALIYHGHHQKKYNVDNLGKAPFVITTYGMISNPNSILHEVTWNRIIFDEAHHLRNPKTSIFQGALRLRSPIKWLLTGTPIQNKKRDFYSLCRVIGFPKDYYKNNENIIQFMLRRTKADVQVRLPTVTMETISVKWNNKQEEKQSKDIHSQLEFSRMSPRAVDIPNEFPIVLMTRARQMCVYPPLIKSGNGASKLTEVSNHILERKNNGKRKLVFCHFRGEIDALKTKLQDQMKVSTFDGRTPMKERKHITNETCDILLMQIQTGCEGLNLQQFSEVYFVSTHWNPAVEDQAIARCHRIGQMKPVSIFRFRMIGFAKEEKSQTLDTYAMGIQEQKRDIASELY